MTESDEETVYVTPMGSNYHTDRECPNLKQAKSVIDKTPSKLNGHKTECKLCKGVVPGRNTTSHDKRNMLIATNPEEVGL